MNFNSKAGLVAMVVVAAASGMGLAAVSPGPTTASVTSDSTVPGNTANVHMRHHRGGLLVGVTLHAMRQLNLTAEQQSQVKSLLSAAHASNQGSSTPDIAVLGNPGDPNYAAAVQTAKSMAAARWQQQIELQSQIYNVLTSEQKAQLPQVLADMKAKAQSRRALWLQKHPGGAPATSSVPPGEESGGAQSE
ncbi:MAG: Spy/CpxP family protein refolding chaperone [Sinobacteraceae bacterium]|nr:Spy/CpxP family protein refolding chaperone [Nevskiaceae bacterium]